MAQLDKLSIVGIRSFDPKKQTIIKFYPVTLILGVNGAGKTTIIESLRYVTSGDAPPGTNNGRTWIHDPQLQSYSGTVRAQLRLKFKAADNIGTIVYRSLELITKRDRNGKVSQQFKTLDSLIKRDAEDGNSTTLGSRCAEIDREMLSLMDVSKAVLTNVVFCHQEDNCWPLSEGKVLKEKFDQIFGSIGYVKALAKVKAYRNKKVIEVRELRAILEKHEEILQQKKRMEKELERVNEDMSSNKRERSVLEEKLKPIQEELMQLAREGESIGQVKTIIAKIKGQLQEKLNTAKKLEERVTDVFSGSLEDLEQQRKTFSTDVNSKQDKVKELNNRLRQIQGELRSNNNRKDAIAIRRGKLEQQEENYKCELLKKENYLRAVSSELNIAVESDIGLEQKIYSFIESEMGDIQSNLGTSSQEKEKNIQTLTDEYEKLKTEKTKAEQTIKMKQETQNKRDREMKEVLNMVNRVEKSACDVAQNSETVIDAVKQLKSRLSDHSAIEPIESKLSDLQISHSSLQDEVSDLKKIYRGLQRDCISDISQVKKEVKELERQMADVSSKLEQVRDSLRQEQRRGNTRLQKLQDYKRKLDHLNENIPENPLASTSQRSFVDDVTIEGNIDHSSLFGS